MPLNLRQRGGSIWDASQGPHLIGNADQGGSVYNRLTSWFDESAFERALTDELGAAPGTLSYRGPEATNVAFMVSNFFTVAEGKRAQFRFELQNATNTPTFGTPNTTLESGGFGRINGYQHDRDAHFVQIGLRHLF
ncbi:MAG: hypothetical protein OXN97_09890 [Bryobacterales bacterium]|nr:hypothetical protein [Bryobacterales bacterium]